MTDSVQHALTRAYQAYQARQFQNALALVESSFQLATPSAAVLNFAAACAEALKEYKKAESYWRLAMDRAPGDTQVMNNFGVFLKNRDRFDEAESIFQRALTISPLQADLLVNQANLFRKTGKNAEAEAIYRLALKQAPTHLDALYNLGLLLAGASRYAEAETYFQSALKIQPFQPDVRNDLGQLLVELNRPSEAETQFREATRLAPNMIVAHVNLGLLLIADRRYQEALAVLKRALQQAPNDANALNVLGNVLVGMGKVGDAEQVFRQALAQVPKSASVLNNLGNLLMKSGRHEEAEALFRRAVELQPDYWHALGQAVTCARQRYSWGTFEDDNKAILHALDSHAKGFPALIVQSIPGATPDQLRQVGYLYAQNRLQTLLETPPLISSVQHPRHDRLRIGYLSADFREHAVMHLAIGVLEHHDRASFLIHAYSIGPNTQDTYRKRAESACEVFRDIEALSTSQIAEQIAADGIDILVDLGGHTDGSRPEITALRPAPIIVNWLGFPGSLGHPRLADYLIGDAVLTPLTHQKYYSETLALMPECYQPNDPDLVAEGCATRSDEGLPEDGIVFCSFSLGYKLNPETFSLWCQLLSEVPGSVLWLQRPADARGADNLLQSAKIHGIAPERLIFARKLPLPQHLARLALADLALDTFPYGSGATGSNILRAGVPMITRIGNTYVSRMAASQLNAVGLQELITENWVDYLRLAKILATDTSRRLDLRRNLATRVGVSALFDTPRFTRHLESIYTRIWSDHNNGIRTPVELSPGGR